MVSVGELVSKDYRNAGVFKKYGIDFCCGGKKSLEDVCREKGIELSKVENDLVQIVKSGNVLPSQDFRSWDADFLADYIVRTHHKYVIRSIPEIFQYVEKVSKVHGQAHPEVKKILEKFIKLADELNRHMMKEENILFPYIKYLAQCKQQNANADSPHFGTVQNPIRMMEHEHDVAGDLMKEIRSLSGNYTPPPDACGTFRVSYAKLKEFEEDLHQHIHLENNILFPNALAMEAELVHL